ncbi:Uncharacterised protein [Klebsiella pneumoniae]|nr:hypothetical protein [Klebsiella pneumoniae IS53]SLO19403.1 Uncharacterised protein [Klebsiella pneumoniae]SLR95872.1 Uncharacterised protein [Klebsiella pneumoniae]SLS87174.1 Uncharacterised protein [Klebsiella pneumoniae]SLS96231.1 Uncharacterised protein [Klebsiella pneumoniae]
MDVRRGWLLVPASFFQSLERPIAIVTDVCRELTLQDEAIEEVAALEKHKCKTTHPIGFSIGYIIYGVVK